MMQVSWDTVLVSVSLIVAFIASFTALDTAGRVAVSQGWLARLWLVAGGTALGIGVWAMHFIGMLALMMPMRMHYDTHLTALSLVVAVVASILALAQVVRGAALHRQRWLLGSGLLALGVVAMHYLGMVALMITPHPRWNVWLVALSVVVAFAASAAALWLAFHLRQGERKLLLMRALASLVMGCAIAGMHYIGMAAASFSLESQISSPGVSDEGLAVWVTIVTLSILGLTLLASMLDAQLRAARLATRLKRANSELQQLAMFDTLTRLPNRAQLDQFLTATLRNATLNDQRFSVMYMDLDGFKAVNDSWGHHVGDRLLLAVTTRLAGSLSADMLLARLGGDEFVLVYPESDEEQAIAFAQQLVTLIDHPFELERYRLRVSLSIGIALFPQHGKSLQTLLFNADSAMYHTKHSGRNGWCLFEPEMSTLAQHQLQLANDLWLALERQEMRLFYQPKFRSSSNTLMGFEALLRWQHPARGLLMPDIFLPRAEKTGQIVALGNWVIDEACRQLRAWYDAGHADWTVSVNLSSLQFQQRDLTETISQALSRHRLLPQGVILEVSENIVMRDIPFSQQRISELQRLGISVAIDNFGIGYANLLQLRHLEATELKIDRSFINSLRADSEDASVVSAMLHLAQSLNLRMVAEGVETEEQQHLLKRLGFDAMQGYLLGMPKPAERISELDWQPAPASTAMEPQPGV
ncbi:putative bifunctional diguanylate cyclase/phosphodiesterase [Pantoea sp. A4]|uniref:putative bifunctional diguanylate cyclase/phosphodiesterase n=1 Tax=Pantoea sp. A4 TaxID=1225184 RepID=UPI000474AA5B|nr:EAL domain-containing protein [Pantoea sp. A4]